MSTLARGSFFCRCLCHMYIRDPTLIQKRREMESCNRSSVKSNHWLLLLLLLLRNCIYPLKSSARLKKSISFRKRGSSINAVAFTHNDSLAFTLMNWVTLISCPKPLTIDVHNQSRFFSPHFRSEIFVYDFICYVCYKSQKAFPEGIKLAYSSALYLLLLKAFLVTSS